MKIRTGQIWRRSLGDNCWTGFVIADVGRTYAVVRNLASGKRSVARGILKRRLLRESRYQLVREARHA